jgi:hypothetical protein
MRIQEIDDVLKLIDDMPVDQQKICAIMMRIAVQTYEEQITMTERQRRKLDRLRQKEREKRLEKWRRMLE